MTTNFQTARETLGARLRELRVEAGLTGRAVAAQLAWQPSKVSKLELGRQTPTADDLSAWAHAIGRPDVEEELTARLRSLETQYASWRRQLAAGTRARQQAWQAFEQARRPCGTSRPRASPACSRRPTTPAGCSGE